MSVERRARLEEEFRGHVLGPSFPCVFSQLPFTNEQIAFSYHRFHQQVAHDVVQDLWTLRRRLDDDLGAVAVVFVDDPGGDHLRTLDDDLELARSVVSAVVGSCEQPPVARDDPLWMPVLAGVGLFFNFSSPRHLRRRSRNVSSAFTVVAQARASFDDYASDRARTRIRERLAQYDDVAPHPSLARYGEPGTREALQYFLGDDDCPHDASLPR